MVNMTIRPLRDLIVVVPVEVTDRVGSIWMPDNKLQGLVTHYRARVLAAGPKAEEFAPVGSEVHISDTFGETVEYEGKKARMGRIRDINGVVQ